MVQKTLLDKPAGMGEKQEGQGILHSAAELFIVSVTSCIPKKK